MAKEFLLRNKIHYVEKDINVDDQARAELAGRNVRGVPAFLIGDEMVVGLDKTRILELVDHRLYECEQCHTRLRVPIDKGSITVTCPKCKHAFNVNP